MVSQVFPSEAGPWNKRTQSTGTGETDKIHSTSIVEVLLWEAAFSLQSLKNVEVIKGQDGNPNMRNLNFLGTWVLFAAYLSEEREMPCSLKNI